MRRILLLVTDLEIGGTPTVVRELAIRLRHPPMVEVEVACLGPWGPVADQLAAAGVRVTALGARGPADVRIGPRLLRRILAGQGDGAGYDTVFSFLVHANAMAAAASIFCPQVRFIQSIQTTQPDPAWHWRVQGVAQGFADRIVVPSASVADVASRWADVPEQKIRVIPNAIDVGAFSRRPDAAGADRDHPARIGFIGRLDPIKRIGDLIEAVGRLEPPVRLDIFGEGIERPRLLELIQTGNLRDRVALRGAVASAQAALEQIDVLALPSAAEGFGLVLIEAMAAGVPVIATDVPGIRDVVRHGVNGLLTPVASASKLADSISVLLGSAELRRKLVSNGLAEVRSRYTWGSVLWEYRRLLEIDCRS